MVCFSCLLCHLGVKWFVAFDLPNLEECSAANTAENLAKETKYYCCVIPAGGFGLPPNTEVMRLIKVDLPQPVPYQRLSNQA